MSAFNVLAARIVCPVCALEQAAEIQFRYGNTWQHRVRVGDPVPWGGNDVGIQHADSVVVEGLAGPCCRCGEPDLFCEILIRSDTIVSVEAVGNPRLFPPEGYSVTS